jgi:hypothetical protein
MIGLLNSYSVVVVDVVWLLQMVLERERDSLTQPAAIVALIYTLARRAAYREEMNGIAPVAPES